MVFWLFSISVCGRIVTVSSDVTVTTSVPSLLPLGSGREKWGDRYLFGGWGREFIHGGYL